MNFPKHPLRDFPDQTNKALSGKQIKMIDFYPYEICEIFQNLYVIQTYSPKENEYLYGIYNPQGLMVGHFYKGTKYTRKQVIRLVNLYMPKKYEEMYQYSIDYPTIEYMKYDKSRYAFIFENIIEKVSEN